MTQLEHAKNDRLTPLMRRLARTEQISPAALLKAIKAGRICIPHNNTRRLQKPCAIGEGLRTKVNANIGTSTDKKQIGYELKKLDAALRYGADAVMDLSVGGNIKNLRKKILAASPVPVGTVPVYEIAVEAQKKYKNFLKFTPDDMLETLRAQAKEGVDFFTLHSGVTRKSIAALKRKKRLMGIVSRGGAMIASWMAFHKEENPFYRFFDEILTIAYEYDITLSLGDGLRPGSIFDATDAGQLCELKILGELAVRARRRNVQVMIEGPGHVSLDQIRKNILLQKKFCHHAPFYVLGPLVTDVASGYDHISSAIGGAMAAGYGADFLCYVTASEHLRHPSIEDVAEGVIAARIAAHAADIVKNAPGARDWDRKMSAARAQRDWKKQIALSIDPEKARRYRMSSKPDLLDVCTMCGKYCSIKLSEQCLG